MIDKIEKLARRSPASQAAGLAGWLLFSFLAAAVGAVASINADQFYATLTRPLWAPPAGVFGPVWSVLYAMIGVAAWLVWRQSDEASRSQALKWFVAQLAVNALWSWLFFAWHLGAWALTDIALLWLLVLATLLRFWRAQPLAGALLLPYLAWISFAAVLNLSVWRLNPGLL